MTRRTIAGVALAVALAGCRRVPRAVYEYEPPVTITSTDRAGTAPAQKGAMSTTLPPRAPVWLRGRAR